MVSGGKDEQQRQLHTSTPRPELLQPRARNSDGTLQSVEPVLDRVKVRGRLSRGRNLTADTGETLRRHG